VLQVARRKDCDHVFLSGGKRSPAGKALFGDFAQSVLLGFDGYVTVRMND
jgi:nucleotide-binding universal stress UspA family protein